MNNSEAEDVSSSESCSSSSSSASIETMIGPYNRCTAFLTDYLFGINTIAVLIESEKNESVDFVDDRLAKHLYLVKINDYNVEEKIFTVTKLQLNQYNQECNNENKEKVKLKDLAILDNALVPVSNDINVQSRSVIRGDFIYAFQPKHKNKQINNHYKPIASAATLIQVILCSIQT